MQDISDAIELKRLEDVLSRVCELSGAVSDAQIARELEAPPSSLASWRRRGTVPFDVIAFYGHRKGININWLLFGTGPQTVQETAEVEMVRLVSTAGQVLGDSMSAPALAFVPFYDVEVAAGHGRQVFDESVRPSAFNAYRRSWLEARGLDAKNLIELPVIGDSMQDELREGDTVLVDTSARHIVGGSIYVLRQEEDLMVKYLQQLPEGDVMVSSENGKAFPSYIIKAHAFTAGDAEVIGRVVRQGRDR